MERNILNEIQQLNLRVGDQITGLSEELRRVSDHYNQLDKPSHAKPLLQPLRLTKEQKLLRAEEDLKQSKEHRRRWEQRRQVVDKWQTENPERVILQDLSEEVFRAMEEEKARTIQDKMLHSLYFPQLKERHSRIPKAHAETFNWALESDSKQAIRWSNLVNWLLRSDGNDNLYWIAGKAGSGKSTLMRYLYDDQRTKNYLRSWANPKKLVIASCFFWNLGTPMQRSLTGLLLSLLYELLSQCPEWMKAVFPWRWQSYELGILNPGPYTNTELLDAFRKLVQKAAGSSNICFFIDGLDEFEGDDTARTEIVNLFKGISDIPDIKVCVSSRPWLIFEDSFVHCSSLLLQQLTYQDIERYVHSQLVDHMRFSKLKEKDASGCSRLVEEIVNKAAGVFLWVYLVVRSLLQGLQNEDGIQDLQRRLRLIPADLEEYFKHMMSTLDPFYLEQARQLFDVAMNAQDYDPLSLLTYSFVVEPDPDFATKAEVRAYGRGDIDSRHESMERRLNSRCKGLLEVYHADNEHLFFSRSVDFLHRTVREFLQTRAVQDMLNEYTSKSFDANIVMCKAYLAQIKALDSESVTRKHSAFLRLLNLFVVYARRVERTNNVAPTTLLDDLDRSSSILWDRASPKLKVLPESEEHWTNRLSLGGDMFSEWCECDPSWKNTFISTTLRAGLRLYVKEKLEANGRLVQEKRGRPLLHDALCPAPFRRGVFENQGPGTEIIRIMLEQGADPNKVYWKDTVWGYFLAFLYDSAHVFLQADKWIEVVELLILHKADRWLDCNFIMNAYKFNEHAKPMDVLRKTFGEEHIPRFERLFDEAQKGLLGENTQSRKSRLLATLRRLVYG